MGLMAISRCRENMQSPHREDPRPGIKPSTFLLCGNSAHCCTTISPISRWKRNSGGQLPTLLKICSGQKTSSLRHSSLTGQVLLSLSPPGSLSPPPPAKKKKWKQDIKRILLHASKLQLFPNVPGQLMWPLLIHSDLKVVCSLGSGK